MLFCSKCKKEVVPYGVSPGAMPAEAIEETRKALEKEGKIVLFNPPMFPGAKHNCPNCSTQLIEKR